MEESYQAWVSLMKASRMRGPVGEVSLEICATNTHMALGCLAQGLTAEKKPMTAKIECLLREALLVRSSDGLCILAMRWHVDCMCKQCVGIVIMLWLCTFIVFLQPSCSLACKAPHLLVSAR